MVLLLSDSAVKRVIDIETLASVVEDALIKQAAGAVQRPDRPHYPIGHDLESPEPLGMAVVMPAYVHGEEYFATKLVSLHEDNEDRGLPTLHAQIVLTNARTGLPLSFMDGTRITNARTGCLGLLAARELASDPVTLAVIGAGAQARWQTRSIAAVRELEEVRVFSPSDSRFACADDLSEEGIPAAAVDSAAEAVEGANVVVTATTATEPVFPADALAPGALVVAVGAFNAEMQELEPAVFDRAACVFADVPEEVATIGDLVATDLTAEDLLPMRAFLDGSAGREADDEIVVVESVGSAVFDAAASSYVYEAAREEGVGSELSL
ncbi:ornithine cyclodeaminase family protein [Natrinema gelatinilyticum]|uniref:ornithine cyclodeaminase family protein n=1 Tax=Natrinema gelatinilyticum TaxID=2961571 RepID=UPI0020C29B6E|nr:ornithine cyclodeaminase family protein [Natrinema gelatinilyticum]